MGYSPQGCKESDTTERLHFTSLHFKRLNTNIKYKDFHISKLYSLFPILPKESKENFNIASWHVLACLELSPLS